MTLILQISYLLIDLNWLPDHFALKKQHQVLQTEIGQVLSTKNNVRRKFSSSILWESPREKDRLYLNDSILTLKGSTAHLQLKGDIRLSLHENTLIVLESPDESKDSGSISLSFAKGNLRSSGKQKINLLNQKWSLDASQGSEISLRSVENGQIEMEVSKGDVTLQNQDSPSKAQSFSQGQKVEISKERVEKTFEITNTFKWLTNGPIIVYSHNESENIQLSWEGTPSNLTILNQGKLEQFSIKEDQKSISLPLQIGQYTITLSKGDLLSDSIEVALIKAPVIRYFSPLPRDRKQINSPTTFTWANIDESVDHYLFEISRTEDFNQVIDRLESANNRVLHTQSLEGEFYWRVKAVDPNGKVIPELYQNKIHYIDQPLQAPKLISPEIRKPANDDPLKEPSAEPTNNKKETTSFLKKVLDLLLPQALAEEIKTTTQKAVKGKSIQLNWYPVEGAQHYFIEISDDPLFTQTLVNEKVKEPQYNWSGFDERVYYWRVAAGTKEKMGLFSDVSEFDVAQLKTIDPAVSIPGVGLVETPAKIVLPPNPQPKVTLPEPKIAKATPIAKKPEPLSLPPILNPYKFILGYSFSSKLYSMENKVDDFKVSSYGFTQFQGELGLEYIRQDRTRFRSTLDIGQFQWEPKEKETLPFQSKFDFVFADWLTYYDFEENRWNFGLHISRTLVFKRKSFESLSPIALTLFGLNTAKEFKINPTTYSEHHFSILIGESTYGISTKNIFWYEYLKSSVSRFTIGPELNFDYFHWKKQSPVIDASIGLKVRYTW